MYGLKVLFISFVAPSAALSSTTIEGGNRTEPAKTAFLQPVSHEGEKLKQQDVDFLQSVVKLNADQLHDLLDLYRDRAKDARDKLRDTVHNLQVSPQKCLFRNTMTSPNEDIG